MIPCYISVFRGGGVLTKTFGFSMGSWIVFLYSLYSPLIMPLETENILQFGWIQM